MKKNQNEVAIIATVENVNNATIEASVENTMAVEATPAVDETPATEGKTKRVKDATPLEIIRQQYAADKKAYIKQAVKNPFTETTVMKGNFTMKKSEIQAFLPKSATFSCRKKHHFDIQFADGVTFYMSPDGFEATSDVSAIDEATKKAVLKFAKNFYTEAVVENIF